MKIVKFGKKGCAPCEQVDEFFKSNNIEYTNINPFETETEEEDMLVFENNIKSIPVTVLIDKLGRVVTRKAGYNEKALSHLIELYQNGQ